MAALGSFSGIQARPQLRSGRKLQVKASSWTQVDRERPWLNIRADGQPMLAPRTEGMQGDPFGSLLRQRTIFMGGEVEDFSADALVSQLLLLDSQDQGKDIRLFINSPGRQPCLSDLRSSLSMRSCGHAACCRWFGDCWHGDL